MRTVQNLLKELDLTYTEQVFLQESGLAAKDDDYVDSSNIQELMDAYEMLSKKVNKTMTTDITKKASLTILSCLRPITPLISFSTMECQTG